MANPWEEPIVLESSGAVLPVTATRNPDGSIAGLSAGSSAIPPVSMSKKLYTAIRPLVVADQPIRMFVAGDSTGDATDEWAYLLSAALAGKYTDHTHDYRVWNHADQQYDETVTIRIGDAGAGHCNTGINATSWKYVIADTDYISHTGDHDIRIKLCLNGSLPSAAFNLCSKYGGAGNRAYKLALNTNGTLAFEASADGTATVIRTSTVGLSGSDLTDITLLRVTYDVDNDSSGNTVTFYKSLDGESWEQIGDPVINAGVTSVKDSITDFTFIGVNMPQQDHAISFYEFQAYASLTGTSRFIDINVGDGYAVAGEFIDRCGNTVIQTVGDGAASGAFVGSPSLLFSNGSRAGESVEYHSDLTRYPKLVHGKQNVAIINHGHNATDYTDYTADYKVLTDALLASNRDTAICCLTQNKRRTTVSYSIEHRIIIRQIVDLCVSQGFDLIDTWTVLPNSMLAADGIHLSAEGKIVQSQFVNRYFGL